MHTQILDSVCKDNTLNSYYIEHFKPVLDSVWFWTYCSISIYIKTIEEIVKSTFGGSSHSKSLGKL